MTEQSTGVRERVVAARCPFTDSPYRVSFEGTAVSFMPGLEFRVQVSPCLIYLYEGTLNMLVPA